VSDSNEEETKMKKQSLGILTAISILGFVAGCSSARDVSLTGTVTADAAVSTGPVRLEFYESQIAGDQQSNPQATPELKFVEAMPLAALGKFSHTVPVEGDKLHLFAFIDADEDDKCTDGEAWGEADVTVQSNDTADATVNIVAQSKCPALPAAN
jgi:hypothetical protein